MKNQIESFLQHHFGDVKNHLPYTIEVLRDFLKLGPLHHFIPKALGGKGQRSQSYLEMIETASYYSLPLGTG